MADDPKENKEASGQEFESEFESEVSEFESEIDTQPEGDSKPKNQSFQIPVEQVSKESLSLKQRISKVKDLLFSLSTNLKQLRTTYVKIGKKRVNALLLIKSSLKLILFLVVTIYSYSYYGYLQKVFDDSFLYAATKQKSEVSDDDDLDPDEEDQDTEEHSKRKPTSDDDDDLELEADKEASTDEDNENETADDEEEFGTMYEVRDVLLNVTCRGCRFPRICKMSIGMELENDDVLEELQQRKTQLRHLIILFLSNTASEDLIDLQKRKKIKSALKTHLNGVLKTGSVKRLFITDLIIDRDSSAE